MKRLFLLLLISCAAAVASAADEFVRITSPEQLTEDGEYVIGAKGSPTYTSFFLLDAYNDKKKNFTATIFSDEIPEQITDPAVPVWHIVREGNRFALSLDGAYMALRKEETVLASYDHVSWQVQPQPDGTFVLTDGQFYFHLYSQEKGSYFKCYGSLGFEGTLVIYKRVLPLSSLTSYARFWEADGWETLCLPFSCPVPQGFEAYAVKGFDGETLTREPVDFLEAGASYVVKGKSAALFAVRKAEAFCDTPQAGCLTGTYVPRRLSTGYVLNGTDFVPVAPGCYLPPFCAYLPQR